MTRSNCSAETGRDPAETVYNGGRWALSGFLYQAVGLAGLVAHACNLSDGDIMSEDLSAIIEVNGIVPERYDQDGVCESLDGQCVFYQLKFSGSPNTQTLDSSEFQEIIVSFVAGARRAKEEGRSVHKFFIVTNKKPHLDVANWMNTGALDDSQKTSIARKIQGRRRSSGIIATLDTIKDEIDAVMRGFHPTVTSWTLQKCNDKISAYAQRFGLDRDQTYQGVMDLTGKLTTLGGLGISIPVNRVYLNKVLTGVDNPCELTAAMVRDNHPPDVDSFCCKDVRDSLVDRREVIFNLEAKLAEGRSLIILSGRGGMGKSCSLADWVVRELQNRPGAMITTIHARNLESGWVADTVRDWSQIGGRLFQSNDMSEALRRLRIANQGSPWTLYLIVDGLDESQNDINGAIRPLLWKFIKRQNNANLNNNQEVVLIATCREKDKIINELDFSGNIRPQNLDECFVDIDTFNDAEFFSAINRLPDSEAKTKFLEIISTDNVLSESSLSGPIGSGGSASVLGNESDGCGFSDPFRKIFEEADHIIALRHPLLWSIFMVLDDDTKLAFIDKGNEGLAKFGEKLIEWFSIKFNNRHSPQWDRGLLESFLTQAAQKTEFAATASNDVFKRLLINENMNTNDAFSLRDEAASSGLIELVGKNDWRWSYQVIPQSFIALGKEQACV